MPRWTNRRCAPRVGGDENLTLPEEWFLRYGPDLLSSGDPQDQLRAWERHGQRVVDHYRENCPGTRPACFYQFVEGAPKWTPGINGWVSELEALWESGFVDADEYNRAWERIERDTPTGKSPLSDLPWLYESEPQPAGS